MNNKSLKPRQREATLRAMCSLEAEQPPDSSLESIPAFHAHADKN